MIALRMALSGLPSPDGLVPFVRGGLERGVDDPSWDHLKMDDKYGRVDAPTFHIGGWYDIFLGETLKQPVIVENKAGGNGHIGASFVAKSAPDGYTLLLMDMSNATIGPSVEWFAPNAITSEKG